MQSLVDGLPTIYFSYRHSCVALLNRDPEVIERLGLRPQATYRGSGRSRGLPTKTTIDQGQRAQKFDQGQGKEKGQATDEF